MRKKNFQKALRDFESKIKEIFPEAELRTLSPISDEDSLIEILLPRKISFNERLQIASIENEIEEKYDITFATTTAISSLSEQTLNT
jgi:hypothetical protein